MTPVPIHLSIAHLCGKELDYIREAFETNWVTSVGQNLDAFENDLADFLFPRAGGEAKGSVVALNSGTAALHLGLIMLDVGQGDEVICQSFTYTASTNPIYYVGARPVFVDSESDTWNLSPEYLEQAVKSRIALGKKPKAIVVVHLYGMPAKMDAIQSIAQKYEIPLLEDAAEALGSTYKGIHCGTFGDIAAISFNGNKIITTSGGGALISKNKEYVRHALFLATQARDLAPHYQHSHIGYNYRMSNILAGIGRGQMTVLPQRIEQRRRNNQYYREHLSSIEGVAFHTEPDNDFYSNYWLTAITVDPAKTGGVTGENIRLALQNANIEARPLWKPMHLQPIFKDCPYYGDGTSQRLFNQGLCLPSGSILTEEELNRVTEKIIRTVLT